MSADIIMLLLMCFVLFPPAYYVYHKSSKSKSDDIDEPYINDRFPLKSSKGVLVSSKDRKDANDGSLPGNILHKDVSYTNKDYYIQNIPETINICANNISLKDTIRMISKQEVCVLKPVFLTIGRIRSDTYVNLVDNFFGTMLRFGHSDCSILVCISDPICMETCKQKSYCCYDFQYKDSSAVLFEQIAAVKIFHIKEALQMGVRAIFILDLDVGFLRDPQLLYQGFLENPFEQIRAQMDVGMTRRVRGVRSDHWISFARPNLGVFLVKSHPLTVMVFEKAWTQYSKIEDKDAVALDQKTLNRKIKWAQRQRGLNFSYFSPGVVPDAPVPKVYEGLKVLAMDKIEFRSKRGILFELGGKAARNELQDTIAVHATCYERDTKVAALKAVNAFWSANYYQQHQRTLIKPLLYQSTSQLRQEIHALAQLAVLTNRSLIIPNIILSGGTDNENFAHTAMYRRDMYYWPSFRTVYNTEMTLEILEPAYYYRLESDFLLETPEPHILSFNIDQPAPSEPIDPMTGSPLPPPPPIDIFKNLVETVRIFGDQERVVLSLTSDLVQSWGPSDLFLWSRDSISDWGKFDNQDRNHGGKVPYVAMPLPRRIREGRDIDWTKSLRMCKNFLKPAVAGNRTCFEKCN